MVGSRHLQGTIISRVKYLLESGSLKSAPLWYDVVRRFPPPKTSILSLVAEEYKNDINKITYPLDDVKREFYKRYFRAARDPSSLFQDVKTEDTKTDLFLKDYQKFVDSDCSHKDAMKQAISVVDTHLASIRGGSRSFEEHDLLHDEDDRSIDLTSSDIYSIFSSPSKEQKN